LLRIVLASLLLASCAATSSSRIASAPLASDQEILAAEQAAAPDWVTENEWNVPMEPFTIIGNVHYVGTKTISAWLITSPKGHVLMDGVVPQSAPQIAANVAKLGYKITDVKYLLNSHAHMDHAGGLAGLKMRSGAKMVASAADKPYLEAGDIGHGPTGGVKFPPVRVDQVIGDGQTLRLGGTTLTAHITPGHSPGCTSWSMKAAGKSIFFHCSATVAGQSLKPEVYPGIVANFRATFAKVEKMEADIFLGNHDIFFDLHGKRARQIAGDANAFVNPGELQAFNSAMKVAFEERLKAEETKR
jgi:metallo-beta-lactamase class B